jgi:Zn-dependent protease/CBS domain-containing protein
MDPQSDTSQRPDNAFLPGSIGTVRLFGVPVRLHFTFLIMAVFLVFFGVGERQSVAANAAYIGALFGSVILHELGHALMGRLFGVKTLEIVMFPIGGVARMESPPSPKAELWIAVAGPLVNLLIGAGMFAALLWSRGLLPWEELLQPTDANLLERIAAANIILAVFNLLPAFPMDGGRILRAALSLWRPVEQATRTAARISQFLAIAMGLYGLLSANYMLVFIAFFVYVGAMQEGAAAVGRMLTQGLPVRAAMVTDFRTLSHGESIRDAANLLLSAAQQDFPVVHGNQVIGLLGRNALLRAMASIGPDSYVATAMDRNFPRLSPDQDLADAMRSLTESGSSCALVMEDDRLLGMLTSENLSEFLLLRKIGMQPGAR